MKVNMFYNELHNTIKDAIAKRNSDRRINEMDDTLSIFDGIEDIDYSKMYPSTDDDKSENVTTVDNVHIKGLTDDPETGEVMDSAHVKVKPDLTKLKWLLLYLMDTELSGKVAHGLPVYLYKDKKHGISAIFNYWQGLNSTEEKYPGTYIELVEQYAKYNMIVITDLMEIAKSLNLDAYAEYIGDGDPYVRVIFNANIYRED